MLSRSKNYKVDTYNYEDNFMVDIVETEETYEAWIYTSDIGKKDMMFGLLKNCTTYEEFLDIVESNIPDYMEDYLEEYA